MRACVSVPGPGSLPSVSLAAALAQEGPARADRASESTPALLEARACRRGDAGCDCRNKTHWCAPPSCGSEEHVRCARGFRQQCMRAGLDFSRGASSTYQRHTRHAPAMHRHCISMHLKN
eukprot:6184444-Pleurochrysis_carterae.AAC.1